MSSVWPGLNLRNFMAHLAPGVYFALQVAIALLFIAWVFDPIVLEYVLKINKLETVPGVVLGFLLLTVCYFVGVTLRLSTVDHLDVRSLDYNLTLKLWEARRDFSPRERRIQDWLGPSVRFLGHLFILAWHPRPEEMTVGAARSLLDQSDEAEPGLMKLLEEWKKGRGEQAKEEQDQERELLRKAIVQFAIDRLIFHKVLEEESSNGVLSAAPVALRYERLCEWVKDPLVREHSEWFRLADSYPYPIRLLYRNWHRADEDRRKELVEKYVPLMLETVIGEWDGARYTHGPINRAKEFVIAKGDRLGPLVLEREALTRMVAGFFPALRIGFCVSTVLLTVCMLQLPFLAVDFWPFRAWWYFFLGFCTLLICNGGLLAKVLKNLCSIRYGEVDTVLEGYLLSKP